MKIDLKIYVLLSFLFSYAAVAGFQPINGGMVNKATIVTSAAGTTTLVATSNQAYIVEGSTTQSIVFPDATLLPVNWWYEITNNSTGAVTVKDNASSSLFVLGTRMVGKFTLSARGSAAGAWKQAILAGLNSSSQFPGSITGNAATATSLASDPTDCSLPGSFANAIDAQGNLTCTFPSGSGDVSGGSVATDNTVARYDGTTGKVIQNSVVLIDDFGVVTAPRFSGPLTGAASSNLLKAGDTMSGALAMGANKITGLADPTSTQDAATKTYVDLAVVNEGETKTACDYATTAALPSLIYANGASGVGATLTGVSLGALSVDSASPTVGQRVLVKNQVSTFQNGIYSVTATGSAGAVFVLTRATDLDQSAEFIPGVNTFIVSGTTNPSTVWDYSGVVSPTLGTTAVTFAQTAGPGSTTIGSLDAVSANAQGLAFTGTVLSTQSADGTHPGMVNTTTQTFAGQKTFSTGVTATLTGTASGNATLTPTNHGVVISGSANAMTATSAGTTGQVLTSNGPSADPTYQAAAAPALDIKTKTANYTVTNSEDVILCNPTSGATITMTLLTSATATKKQFFIKNISSAGTCIVASNAADLLEGDTTLTLLPGGTPQSGNIFIPDGSTSWSIW